MTNEEKYKKLLTFLGEAEKLKSTLRHNWMRSGRQEDSSQHSWRAALFFIIADKLFHFNVDSYKTVSMLIIHDMPESTFGDIPAFIKDTDEKKHKDHKLREEKAAQELYKILPSPAAEDLTSLQEEFDRGESNEARVAQALEKIESQLQHLESGPKYWGEAEKGQHMLHYPDKVLAKLNNPHIHAIWQIIYHDIYDLTYPEEKLTGR